MTMHRTLGSLALAAALAGAACTSHRAGPSERPTPAPTRPAAPATPGVAAAPTTPGAGGPSGAAGRVGRWAPDTGVRAMASPFYPLERSDWPGPNQYRDATGAPGPDYWQQRVDYTITATLDTASQTLTGTVTARYVNNSPDTLRFVWMQLDQNLFRPGSKGSALYGAGSRNAGGGFPGGYTLGDVTVDGKPVVPRVDDTMMRLDLPAPLPSRGGRATIVVHYSFRVPEHGADRMGRDGPLYELAQWYPRMAVYDDVRGWNTDPYLGQGEFYLEYGDIDYAVTVPAGYTVAGSGVLQNPAEVLGDSVRRRLARAITSSAVVPIVTASEAESHRRPVPGMKTWRFRAQNVRDVAWAGAPDFRWDATSVRGVLCQSFYEWPKSGPEWEHVAENTQWTIRTYSELISPYPYPQASSVAGPVSGMEYPMFVMDGYTDTSAPGSVFRTNDHEHGHEWFPMIVGSNERRYAWMDEGINTYWNAFSQERRYGGDVHAWPDGMDNWASFLGAWAGTVGAGIDAPMMTAPDHIEEEALANDAYEKPAAVLLALRDHVVSREAMDRAFREYVRRWSFKHPTPGDFFRTVENVTGADLSWFWRGYFYTTDLLDIGIDSVVTQPTSAAAAGEGGSPGGESAGTAGGGRGRSPSLAAVLHLRRTSALLFPVSVRLKLADGSMPEFHFPVDIWARGMTADVQIVVPARVVGARLWPDRTAIPDFRPENDVWGDAPPATPPGPATTGGLASDISPR